MSLVHPTAEAAHAATSGEAAPARFRERVRARSGGADLLVFRIGREYFGVELKAVEELVESPDVRPVPESPTDLLGVFALRDQLLPVFSPAAVLGVEAGEQYVALVMRSGRRRVALAVDDAEDVRRVSFDELRDVPSMVDDDLVAGVHWRDGQLTTVLDARALVGACIATRSPDAP